METYTSIKDFLEQRGGDIFSEMMSRLRNLPQSPYRDFIVKTDEGERALRIWVGLIFRSLQSDRARQSFFLQTERAGYARAIAGFKAEDVFQTYRIFQEVFWETLHKVVAAKEISLLNDYKEVSELNQILSQASSILAVSFLRTREETITEKVSHLQGLYSFTQEIVTIFNLEDIAKYVSKKLISSFGVEACILVVYRDHGAQEVYGHPVGKEFTPVLPIVEKTLVEGTPVFVDEAGDIYKEIGSLFLKRVVSAPIQAHGHCYGILTLYNESRGFKFTNKELELLYQFIYVIGEAFENAFMLEEIERGRQELRLLTNKIITLQEEERRRLAEDIHDTLAQALTGIGYKVQYCKELLTRNPQLLERELDRVIENINHTIDQSREIISSLRPDLIDTMGLVPALKRYIGKYVGETGISVISHFPKRVKLSPRINICFFRVAQEALTNVHKHAGTKTAEIELKIEKENIILLVADRGRGFDISRETCSGKGQVRLGLLSMKERLKALGGILTIDSEVNRGCRIEAKISLCDKARLQG
jgi:signal transduction histidine kinase